jgi:hypothetical protein
MIWSKWWKCVGDGFGFVPESDRLRVVSIFLNSILPQLTCSCMNLIGTAKVLVQVVIVLASIVSIVGWLST